MGTGETTGVALSPSLMLFICFCLSCDVCMVELREHPALWFRCCDLDYPGFPIVYYVFRQMLVSNWELGDSALQFRGELDS